jgi:hypothetical protein
MSNFLLQNFQGDEPDSNKVYRNVWRPTLVSELSRHAFPVHPHGLLGMALGAIEYQTFDPHPFVRRAAPLHPGPAGTAAQWSFYKDIKTDFDTQEQAEALAVRTIIASLGDTPKELLRDPVTRRYITNLPQILEILDLHYMVVTRQELLHGINTLSERYSPTRDFKGYLTSHRQLHNTFAHAGQPLSEMDKVKYLSAGVDFDPELKSCINLYFTTVPDLGAQNFTDLALRIERLMANRPSPTVNEFVGAAMIPSNVLAENESLKSELL